MAPELTGVSQPPNIQAPSAPRRPDHAYTSNFHPKTVQKAIIISSRSRKIAWRFQLDPYALGDDRSAIYVSRRCSHISGSLPDAQESPDGALSRNLAKRSELGPFSGAESALRAHLDRALAPSLWLPSSPEHPMHPFYKPQVPRDARTMPKPRTLPQTV